MFFGIIEKISGRITSYMQARKKNVYVFWNLDAVKALEERRYLPRGRHSK